MVERPFVVVIDDDASVCKAVRRLLKAAQMDVETYPSAEAFLRARDRLADALLEAGPATQVAVIELTGQPRVLVAFGDQERGVRHDAF